MELDEGVLMVGCRATQVQYALTQLRLNPLSSLSLHIPLPHGRGYLTPPPKRDSAAPSKVFSS